MPGGGVVGELHFLVPTMNRLNQTEFCRSGRSVEIHLSLFHLTVVELGFKNNENSNAAVKLKAIIIPEKNQTRLLKVKILNVNFARFI
jgi:hypothetical protein